MFSAITVFSATGKMSLRNRADHENKPPTDRKLFLNALAVLFYSSFLKFQF